MCVLSSHTAPICTLPNRSALLQIRAVIQPLAPQKAYSSCPRNSIRSRAWGTASEGCSYRVMNHLDTLSDCRLGSEPPVQVYQQHPGILFFTCCPNACLTLRKPCQPTVLCVCSRQHEGT